MAVDVSGQADWGGGIYRGRRAPENAVYDATNALINDEGNLFRRGGSAYKNGANAGSTLVGLSNFVLPGAKITTLFWSTSNLFALEYGDDTTTDTLLIVGAPTTPRPFARGAGVADSWYLPRSVSTSNQVVRIVAGGSAPGVGFLTVPPTNVGYVTAVGSPARLIVTNDNRAYFSEPGDPTTMGSSNYHELAQQAQIIGADSLGDTCVLFTTQGVWTISNMSFDPVDAAGNVQHQVQRVSDLILWGDPGITGYAGALIVPAIDDVWLFSPDSPPQSISGDPDNEKIRRLYRGYVKSGYSPGTAAVHRGHYFLPIVDGSNVVQDVLVCRLDRGFAWTRWSGHAASGAFAVRVGSSTRTPKLFGIAGQRVTDLTSTFDPTTSNAQDADATNFDCVITTRDFPTSGTNHPGTAVKARLRYELVDDGNGGTPAPTVAIAYSSDQDGGSFTTLSNPILESAGTAGGGVSDGSKYSAWPVGKMRERIRYRITMSGAAASFVLRTFEQLVRQGRLR